MAKLEELKCPNCGARLIEIDNEYFYPTYHCDYCGADFNKYDFNLREIRPQTVKVLSAKIKIPQEKLSWAAPNGIILPVLPSLRYGMTKT